MRYYLLIISIMLASALRLEAQPKLTFEQETYDFGAIMWKQPATAKFTITNTGNKPLVIHKVEASCGCVVSSWPRHSIHARKSATVEATFDARMLGHFNKWVAVYSNASSKPVYVSMVGVVSTEVVDYSRNYPFQIGEIHLDKNQIEFPDAHRGDRPVVEIRVANGSSKTYTPVLMHLPSYVEAEAFPAKLKPKEGGIIRVTLKSDEMPVLGINRSSVYLARFPGDKVGDDNQLDLISVILPDFSGLTATQRGLAPAAQLSGHELDLGKLGDKKTLKGYVTITNTGRSALKFEDIQVTHPALNISLKKQILEPGKSVKLRVKVNGKYLRKRPNHTPRILMITNDPNRPKIEVTVKIGQ